MSIRMCLTRQGMETLTNSLSNLWNEHAEWSEKTFGTDKERGPMGPLEHLGKEAKEAWNAANCWEDSKDALDNPVIDAIKSDLKEELADCFLLLMDATRRSGISFRELVELSQIKLNICKNRVYHKPQPGDNRAVEHDRTLDKD